MIRKNKQLSSEYFSFFNVSVILRATLVPINWWKHLSTLLLNLIVSSQQPNPRFVKIRSIAIHSRFQHKWLCSIINIKNFVLTKCLAGLKNKAFSFITPANRSSCIMQSSILSVIFGVCSPAHRIRTAKVLPTTQIQRESKPVTQESNGLIT